MLIIVAATGCFRSEEAVKKRQQFAMGKGIYKQKCQNCHKENGEGFQQLYPPLNEADYMFDSIEKVACGIQYGMKGSIEVNGKEYNVPMPGYSGLTKYEVAQVMTYIYNAWDNRHSRFTADEVEGILEDCDGKGEAVEN